MRWGGWNPPELAWWTGGETKGLGCRTGLGGRRGDDSSKEEGGLGLVGCSKNKEEQVQGRGQGRVGLAVGGGARACRIFVVSDVYKKKKNVFF